MTRYQKMYSEMPIEKATEMLSVGGCSHCIHNNDNNCMLMDEVTCEQGVREWLEQEVENDTNRN